MIPAKKKWRYIATLLSRSLASGKLGQNERLPPEREMSKLYGVSRGTVRKALLHLEKQGIVEIRPNSGTYVVGRPGDNDFTRIDLASPLELMEARSALEPYVCMLAVLHGRQDDLTKLELLWESMERCGSDTRKFTELDIDFHQSIVECTHNSLLIGMVDHIGNVRRSEEWMQARLQILNTDNARILNQHHRRILDAIKTRRADKAAKAMREHLGVAQTLLARSDQFWEALSM